MKLIDKIKSHPSIDDVWDEGEDGKWASLKLGYIDSESGCHALHERTWTELHARFRFVRLCNCQDCVKTRVIIAARANDNLQ